MRSISQPDRQTPALLGSFGGGALRQQITLTLNDRFQPRRAPAMGTMPNATNGVSLGLNWTAGKLPAVNGSNGSMADGRHGDFKCQESHRLLPSMPLFRNAP